MKKRKLDIVVISDVHLGTFGCHAKELLYYLSSIKPKILILNGDIIDIWQFRKSYFPADHLKVIKKIISLSTKGTKIYYLTGNHDEFLRKFTDLHLGSISLLDKLVLELDGKKAWFFHGDVFDSSITHTKWLAKLGGWGYDYLILLNRFLNWILVKLNKEPYSLSKKIKNNVKSAVKFITNFENVCTELAIENQYDYVICGHIHEPKIEVIENQKGKTVYLNSGDWVENLTALEYNNKNWKLYKHNKNEFLLEKDEELHFEYENSLAEAFIDKLSNRKVKSKTPRMNKNILVAPLNWGLGHATRCIPIIKQLELNGFTPIIASDGVALAILKKEFPHIKALELPSYQIEYPKNGFFFKLKIIVNSHKMINAILKEKSTVKKWITEYQLSGIISDNRLGARNKTIPSVFITHQLNVMTGNTTWISSKMHQYIIKKFNECWVPDVNTIPNLTGDLGHLEKTNDSIKYIGPLSRLEAKIVAKKYDLMVILSGPEPQRTFLEEKLSIELLKYDKKVIFIKGKIESQQTITVQDHITFYNYMNSQELETAFNESELVLCRSGYTTVMDLAKLGKKAFFIPTPGQYEQEYLAKKYKKEGLVPYCKQNKFKIKKLLEVDLYKGLQSFNQEVDWQKLFEIFSK